MALEYVKVKSMIYGPPEEGIYLHVQCFFTKNIKKQVSSISSATRIYILGKYLAPYIIFRLGIIYEG